MELKEDLIKKRGVYVTLGNFDGLHKGHMTLIHKVLELAKKNNSYSMLYSFSNHPLSLINSDLEPKLLMNNKDKVLFLKKAGIDIVKLVKFDENLMKTSARDFIKNLIYKYNVKGIVIGFNYRFGYKNQGDIILLRKLSKEMNFELNVMPEYLINNNVVSSTLIRKMISSGNIKEANKMLFLPFGITGKVVKGRQIGRTIDFPTANLDFNSNFIVPAIGVYYTNVKYKNTILKGITSVGYNPTVSGKELTIETFILDFKKDIYGDTITVYFIDKIRDEKKFASLSDLKEQLKKDKRYAQLQNITI